MIYPRPARDNGQCVHGGPNVWFPLGRQEKWPENRDMLQRIKPSWAVILGMWEAKDAALWAVDRLIEMSIEPIVRLFADRPGASRMNKGQWSLAKELKARGVHYVIVGNEQNLTDEWPAAALETDGMAIASAPMGITHKTLVNVLPPDQEPPTNFSVDVASVGLPADAPEQVAQSWAMDAAQLIDMGLFPISPPLAPGGHWDDVDFFRRMVAWWQANNCLSLFAHGAIIGCHNYYLNHPLLFPYDEVNQQNPPPTGTGILDPGQSNGFLKPKAYQAIFLEAAGFACEVACTEGGPVIGYSPDTRYPAIDKWSHQQAVLDTYAYMEDVGLAGVLCVPGYWIMACRDWEGVPIFEGAAWKSFLWADMNGYLPIVGSLAARPFRERKTDAVEPEPSFGSLEETIIAAVRKRVNFETYPFLTKVAAKRGYLKEPLTDEFQVDYAFQSYMVRAFGDVALYVPYGEWTDEATREVKWL